MKKTNLVDWHTYAQKYDMLLAYNPFYQELHQEVMQRVSDWKIKPGDVLADIGAGTGNYSLELARKFPEAKVLHVDRDEGMNAVAKSKQLQQQLNNHHILSQGIQNTQFPAQSFRGLISIHALYTFPDPQKALKSMYKWLAPEGDAVLVNAGRIINVLDWQLAIGGRLLRKYGVKKTLQVFRKGKEVSRQNAYIRKMQKEGIFWTHSHQEFCQAVENAGFEIQDHQTLHFQTLHFQRPDKIQGLKMQGLMI